MAPTPADSTARMLQLSANPFESKLSLYKITLENGAPQELASATNAVNYEVDAGGDALARVDTVYGSIHWKLFDVRGRYDRLVLEGNSEDGRAPRIRGRLASSELAIIDRPAGRERWMLRGLDVATGAQRTELEDVQADVADVVLDPWTHMVVGIYLRDKFMTQRFVDPALAAVQARVSALDPGVAMLLLNWSLDRRRFVVFLERAADAGGFYLFEPATNALRLLGLRYPAVKGPAVGRRQAINYTARDGTKVAAYLTLPAGNHAPTLPLAVVFADAPGQASGFEFDWLASFIASRGHAVLQADARGTSGYGRAWEQAIDGRWRALVLQDVEDAVDALAHSKIIDDNRVCLMGRGHGGFLALSGVTTTTREYRCAIGLAAISDLPKTFAHTKRRAGTFGDELNWWRRVLGAPAPDTAFLAERSPAHRAAQATAPVLLIHGDNDFAVPVEQSERMADALEDANKVVRFVERERMDHGMSLPSDRIAVLQEIERFLAEHLAPASASHAGPTVDAVR